jgi:Flp pilus assembly protein TadD
LIPDNEQAYLSVGGAYIYLGRYEDAITVLQRSISLRPTARGYSNLGSTYLRLRRFEQAIPVFEQAVSLFPRNYIFAGNLSRAYEWAGQHAKATASYEHAISLASDELKVNPRDADAHISVARYSAMLGRKIEALNHLTTALTLKPNEAEYRSYAAVIHNQLGDRASALASLKKAISLGWSMAEINSEIELDSLRSGNDFQKMVGTN